MYIPHRFAEDDPETLHDIMREHGFALLIPSGDGEPVATHLPLMLEIDAHGEAVLCGHMARSNRHLDALAAGSSPDGRATARAMRRHGIVGNSE